jgi:hypothetical protein
MTMPEANINELHEVKAQMTAAEAAFPRDPQCPETVEQQIQRVGATRGPRITPADVEANIAHEYYFIGTDGIAGAMGREECAARGLTAENAPGQSVPVRVLDVHVSLALLTFCVLVLRNGYTVHGVNACASPENYNAEVGKRIARENAVREIWPLMGYALRETIYRGGRGQDER